MIDLRRFPRYLTKLKAHFPNDENVYEVLNISYKGCFIRTEKKIPIRKIVYVEIEIPDVGLIPIYGVVIHHLKLLETEKIVERKGKRPHVWLLTGLGQKRLKY